MISDEVIKKMRARVAQCRRLASQTTDLRATVVLNEMANEGEADIQRLLDEKSVRSV
jgi:hypothetical protein